MTVGLLSSKWRRGAGILAAASLVLALLPIAHALAQAAAPAAPAAADAAAAAPKLDSGDTAWMLSSTALVLMMTIPGLALFYGGMVRKMNVLATVMQSFAVTCLVTVLWLVVGYSLAFTSGSTVIGGLSRVFLRGLTLDGAHDLAKTIPETVFLSFQLTFAIITPALIAGAFAERMKFSSMLWFIGLWAVFVYAPVAHWVWGPDGFLAASAVGFCVDQLAFIDPDRARERAAADPEHGGTVRETFDLNYIHQAFALHPAKARGTAFAKQ